MEAAKGFYEKNDKGKKKEKMKMKNGWLRKRKGMVAGMEAAEKESRKAAMGGKVRCLRIEVRSEDMETMDMDMRYEDNALTNQHSTGRKECRNGGFPSREFSDNGASWCFFQKGFPVRDSGLEHKVGRSECSNGGMFSL